MRIVDVALEVDVVGQGVVQPPDAGGDPVGDENVDGIMSARQE